MTENQQDPEAPDHVLARRRREPMREQLRIEKQFAQEFYGRRDREFHQRRHPDAERER